MMKKNYMAVVFCMAVLIVSVLAKPCSGASREKDGSGIETDVRRILDTMSTEQKIAQMIMPAIRTWEDVIEFCREMIAVEGPFAGEASGGYAGDSVGDSVGDETAVAAGDPPGWTSDVMFNWAGTPFGQEVSAVHSWAVLEAAGFKTYFTFLNNNNYGLKWLDCLDLQKLMTDSDFINDVCMACNAGGGSPHVFPADSTVWKRR